MFETARAQSELFALQCSQWELIWNSQLIGRYKEMSPGESYDLPPPFWNCQSSEWTLCFSMQSMSNEKQKSSVKQEQNLKQAQIFRFTQVKLTNPPIWNCQSTEWPLRFWMQSMSTHLKQSNNRKI